VMMTRGSMLCCTPATLLTIEILSRRCAINFEWFCVCHDHCGSVQGVCKLVKEINACVCSICFSIF
jgi:hypothetical protein